MLLCIFCFSSPRLRQRRPSIRAQPWATRAAVTPNPKIPVWPTRPTPLLRPPHLPQMRRRIRWSRCRRPCSPSQAPRRWPLRSPRPQRNKSKALTKSRLVNLVLCNEITSIKSSIKYPYKSRADSYYISFATYSI